MFPCPCILCTRTHCCIHKLTMQTDQQTCLMMGNKCSLYCNKYRNFNQEMTVTYSTVTCIMHMHPRLHCMQFIYTSVSRTIVISNYGLQGQTILKFTTLAQTYRIFSLGLPEDLTLLSTEKQPWHKLQNPIN